MRNYEQMIQNDTKWPKHDKIISNEIQTITKKSVEVYLSTCSYQSVFGPQVWLKETQQWAEKETFGLPESFWGTALVWWLTNCSLMNVWCSSGLFVRSVKKLQRLKGESWAFLSMPIPREKLQKCPICVLWFILLIIVIILHQSVIWMSNGLQWLILCVCRQTRRVIVPHRWRRFKNERGNPDLFTRQQLLLQCLQSAVKVRHQSLWKQQRWSHSLNIKNVTKCSSVTHITPTIL